MSSIKIVIERKLNNASNEKQKTDMGQSSVQQRQKVSRKRISIVLICIVSAVLIAWLIVSVITKSASSHKSQSQETLAQINNFTPYFFSGSDTALGFRLVQNGIVYSDGVLFISLVNSANQTVSITEQSLPPALAHSNDIVGDETVTGVDGIAAIAHVGGRINGSMISRNHRTLITLTCPAAVGSTTTMDLMRILSPVSMGH